MNRKRNNMLSGLIAGLMISLLGLMIVPTVYLMGGRLASNVEAGIVMWAVTMVCMTVGVLLGMQDE